MKKAVLGLGIVVTGIVAALVYATRVKAAPPPPVEPGVVTVALKNPPSGANKWQILIIDWDATKSISWGVDDHDNIRDLAIFDILTWSYPLRVSIAIFHEWQENGEWHARQLYKAQSSQPYLWDFEKMEWSDVPDPTYREIFIDNYGNYFYNVAAERFEKR